MHEPKQRLSEAVSKRVVIMVIIILLVVPLLDVQTPDYSSKLGLTTLEEAQAGNVEEPMLRKLVELLMNTSEAIPYIKVTQNTTGIVVLVNRLSNCIDTYVELELYDPVGRDVVSSLYRMIVFVPKVSRTTHTHSIHTTEECIHTRVYAKGKPSTKRTLFFPLSHPPPPPPPPPLPFVLFALIDTIEG